MSGCIGLQDKLYWRRSPLSTWHAYKKASGTRGYVSLCGRFVRRRSGGQRCNRPPAELRCARCDTEEMKRRGKEESCDTSPDWERTY